jgi:hypothetical protein
MRTKSVVRSLSRKNLEAYSIGRTEPLPGRIYRRTKYVVRSSDSEGFACIQNPSFGALTRNNLEAHKIRRSEL